MRISPTQFRTPLIALAIVFAGIPAAMPYTTAAQSVALSDMSKRVLPSILSLKTGDANGHPGIPGTGFFIGSGLVATDYRVIKDAITIQAASPNGDTLDLAIVAVDERRTVALLKVLPQDGRTGDGDIRSIKLQKRPVLIWTSPAEQPGVGDEVYLFSNYAAAGGALLPGKIDEVREEAGTTYFHLAGSFSPDSVGSPVLSAEGNLVGMIVAKSGDGHGPSFGIPADQIRGCGSEGVHIRFTGGGQNVPDYAIRRGDGEAVVTTPPREDSASLRPVRKAAGVLQGSALRRVPPLYPSSARDARISGAVVVEVTVDEEGDPVSARAVSGHPMLKPCAEAAARGWKFTPTILSGNPVKVIGTLTFNFTVGDQPTGGNTTEPGSGAGPGYDAARNGGTLDPSANQTMVDNHPVLLNAPGLHYTELARTNRTEGSVVARVLVGSDGLVKDVRIIRGLPDGLNEEAVRAAYQIRFTPAMKDGEPVPYWQVMEMEFHLR